MSEQGNDTQSEGHTPNGSYRLPITTATLEALGRLNREVVLALAGEEHRADSHFKFRLGLFLTPTSQVHHSRYSSQDNSLEALGINNLDNDPPVIGVPQELIAALGLS